MERFSEYYRACNLQHKRIILTTFKGRKLYEGLGKHVPFSYFNYLVIDVRKTWLFGRTIFIIGEEI